MPAKASPTFPGHIREASREPVGEFPPTFPLPPPEPQSQSDSDSAHADRYHGNMLSVISLRQEEEGGGAE